jgi:serralysin
METGSDTFTGFSVAIGSPWNDTLTASVGSTVYGGAGADSIIGAATGANFLRGDDGDDAILGGAGYNNVNGNKGDDTITGKSLVGDWLLGGQGNDQIDASASPGANILNGNIGADTILGGAGNDTLRGGQGDDLIRGGAGDDTFFGDLGNNTITGGAGADTFRNGNGVARDLITDFHQSEGDRVMIAANLTYTPPSQVGADVEIHVSNGDVLVLQNTLLTSLTSGWVVST